MKINTNLVRQQIDALKRDCPDLMEDSEAWAISLESETDLDTVLTQIVRRIEDAKALASGTKERLTELQERKARFEARVDVLRKVLLQILQEAGVKKRELPEATVSFRDGAKKLVGDADPKTMPDELCKISREIDRAKVKAMIEDGVIVTGFNLSNGEPYPVIKVK